LTSTPESKFPQPCAQSGSSFTCVLDVTTGTLGDPRSSKRSIFFALSTTGAGYWCTIFVPGGAPILLLAYCFVSSFCVCFGGNSSDSLLSAFCTCFLRFSRFSFFNFFFASLCSSSLESSEAYAEAAANFLSTYFCFINSL
jgi:hypothetical protein